MTGNCLLGTGTRVQRCVVDGDVSCASGAFVYPVHPFIFRPLIEIARTSLQVKLIYN
jgi:hypothetical protein